MKNGHAVRVFGCGKTMGKPYIRYKHDSLQSHHLYDPYDTVGLEEVQVYVEDLDGDGHMNWGDSSQEIWFALAESVKEPILIWIPDIFLTLVLDIILVNEAAVPIVNEPWSIQLDGLLFQGGYTEGEITLQPDTETHLQTRAFGIGPVQITVNVGHNTVYGSCFMIGPFILLQSGEN